MLYIKVFSQFLFYLIGTFLHELAHYLAAKMTFSHVPKYALIEEEDENGNKYTKEVSGFTIIPKIKKDRVVYGHVLAAPKFNAAYMLIAIAPLVWLAVLYYFLKSKGFIYLSIENGLLSFQFDYIRFFSIDNLLVMYTTLQLIWAGTLSSQDIKMFFTGLFSVSSIVLSILFFTVFIFIVPSQLQLNIINNILKGVL